MAHEVDEVSEETRHFDWRRTGSRREGFWTSFGSEPSFWSGYFAGVHAF